MDLVTDLQSAEQVVPAVGTFHDPAPSFESRIPLAFLFFLSPRFDVSDISPTCGRTPQRRVVVALVAAQVLPRFVLRRWSRDHDGIQGRTEVVHVVAVGAGERDRQGDAVRVREDMPLGAQFAAIRGVFSRLVPPFTGAETVAESRDWKRQSTPWRSS